MRCLADRKRPIASASTALWGESGATLGAAGEARQVSATFIGGGLVAMRTNHEYRASQARAKWGDLTHPRAIQINLRLTECSAHQRYDLCAWRVRLARDKRALLPQGCTGVANGRRVDVGQQFPRLDRPRDLVHGKVTVSLPPAKVEDNPRDTTSSSETSSLASLSPQP